LGTSTATPGSKVSFLEKKDNTLWVVVSRENQHVIEPWIEDVKKGKGYRALKHDAVEITREDKLEAQKKETKRVANG
jgi:hypothetical protein